MSRVRLVPVIFIIIITLSVLFGSFVAYRHFKLVGPLQSKLESIAGVKVAQIDTGNPSQIVVQLGPVNKLQNQDLQTTYDTITNKISGIFGSTTKLQIQDNRNAELSSTYENLYPILAQGIHNGNYIQMIPAYEQKANQAGIHAHVTMDLQNIYVQLWKGSYYLYKVIPYNITQGGGTP